MKESMEGRCRHEEMSNDAVNEAQMRGNRSFSVISELSVQALMVCKEILFYL